MSQGLVTRAKGQANRPGGNKQCSRGQEKEAFEHRVGHVQMKGKANFKGNRQGQISETLSNKGKGQGTKI